MYQNGVGICFHCDKIDKDESLSDRRDHMNGLEIFDRIKGLEYDIAALNEIIKDISGMELSNYKIETLDRIKGSLLKEVNDMKTTLEGLNTEEESI